MATSLNKQIVEILKENRKDSADLLAKALEIGIHRIWADRVLQKFLSGKISRKKAISLVGIDLIKLAEKQKNVCLEDISWGLST